MSQESDDVQAIVALVKQLPKTEVFQAVIYVDSPIYRYGRMVMCHMIAGPEHIDQLHAMASKLGVRKWFQSKSRYPHYDICKSKRAEAIRLGTVEATREQVVAILDLWKAIRQPPK